MRKSKFLAMTLSATLFLTVCSGCGSNQETPASDSSESNTESSTESNAENSTESSAKSSTDSSTLTVAFSQCGNQNNWKVVQTNDMKEKIEGAGYKYIYTDAQDDTAKQVSDIEDVVAQKPDYLVVSPREAEGLNPVLKSAMEADIPVILVDRGINGEAGVDYTVLNCGDFIWEGTTVAQYMKEQFGDERCNVVELTGTPGGSVTIDRGEGFAEEIAKYDNINVIASQVGNFSRAESQKAMENLIQAHGDEIDAVYAHNDDNAIGAIQAIKAAGLNPGEDIRVYGIDGQKDALQAIVDGDLENSVLCSPRFGDSVLEIIEKLEAGETVEGFIANPGKLYTIENAEECLDEAY